MSLETHTDTTGELRVNAADYPTSMNSFSVFFGIELSATTAARLFQIQNYDGSFEEYNLAIDASQQLEWKTWNGSTNATTTTTNTVSTGEANRLFIGMTFNGTGANANTLYWIDADSGTVETLQMTGGAWGTLPADIFKLGDGTSAARGYYNYFRYWDGEILTESEFKTEAQNAAAQHASAVIDAVLDDVGTPPASWSNDGSGSVLTGSGAPTGTANLIALATSGFTFDETLLPNAVSLTNLTGAYTDIAEGVGSPDGNWLTAI